MKNQYSDKSNPNSTRLSASQAKVFVYVGQTLIKTYYVPQKKVGNVSEALWENRKAIALATGETAATVRASTHYNNGKIYEDAKQWNDALREYNYAKHEKANDVYDKAIKRLQKRS